MTFIQKLQEREFQKLIITTAIFIFSLFGVKDDQVITKIVAGAVDAAVGVAYIASRGKVKAAEIAGDAAVESAHIGVDTAKPATP